MVTKTGTKKSRVYCPSIITSTSCRAFPKIVQQLCTALLEHYWLALLHYTGYMRGKNDLEIA